MRGVPLVASSPVQYSQHSDSLGVGGAAGDPQQDTPPHQSAGDSSPSQQQQAHSMEHSPAAAGQQSRRAPQYAAPQALDIHAYAPPWKSLAEYASSAGVVGAGTGANEPPQTSSLASNQPVIEPAASNGGGGGGAEQRALNAASPRYQQLMSQVSTTTTTEATMRTRPLTCAVSARNYLQESHSSIRSESSARLSDTRPAYASDEDDCDDLDLRRQIDH